MSDPTAFSVIPTPDAANYAPAMPMSGDLNEQLLGSDFWTDDMVAAAGIPVVDVPFVTIGGGIGSFVTVDYLRIAGVPTHHIRSSRPSTTPGRPTSTSPGSRRSRAPSGSAPTRPPAPTTSGASRPTP